MDRNELISKYKKTALPLLLITALVTPFAIHAFVAYRAQDALDKFNKANPSSVKPTDRYVLTQNKNNSSDIQIFRMNDREAEQVRGPLVLKMSSGEIFSVKDGEVKQLSGRFVDNLKIFIF